MDSGSADAALETWANMVRGVVGVGLVQDSAFVFKRDRHWWGH